MTRRDSIGRALDLIPPKYLWYREEWEWRLGSLGLAVGASVLGVVFKLGIGEVTNALAAGLLVVMSVGASAAMAALAAVVQSKFKEFEKNPVEARQILRQYMAIQWINTRGLMVCTAVACGLSVVGALALPPWVSEIVGGCTVGLVLMGLRRWWLLTRSVFLVALGDVETR